MKEINYCKSGNEYLTHFTSVALQFDEGKQNEWKEMSK